MNKQMFRDYIDCFNRDDFAGFSRRTPDDVVLELPKKELRGPEAIVDFYRVVKARIRELLNEIVADAEGLAAEVDTEFFALGLAGLRQLRPVKKNDSIIIQLRALQDSRRPLRPYQVGPLPDAVSVKGAAKRATPGVGQPAGELRATERWRLGGADYTVEAAAGGQADRPARRATVEREIRDFSGRVACRRATRGVAQRIRARDGTAGVCGPGGSKSIGRLTGEAWLCRTACQRTRPAVATVLAHRGG